MNRTLLLLVLVVVGLIGCDDGPTGSGPPEVIAALAADARGRSIAVSGTGAHYFTTAVIHSQEQTETGMIQRSTDMIRLSGDIEGYVLYHPTSVFDYGRGTLVNTGTQLFSGTIAGSAPVVLHDDSFRFEIDLDTGATTGEVHLRRSKDAPHPDGWFECDLDVVGTGLTPEGDAMVEYTGECTPRGSMSARVETAVVR